MAPDDPSYNPPPAGTTSEQAVDFANQALAGTLLEMMGMEFLEIGFARIVARMPVAGNMQPYGLLHGGATATLCEGLASFGTAVHAGLDKRVIGIELNVNHIRAVSEGHITASRSTSAVRRPYGTCGSKMTPVAWSPSAG